MAGFKRPFRIVNDAAGVCFSVQVCLGLRTYWALFATPPTCLRMLVQSPGFPKLIDIICLFAVGTFEVVSGIVVVVATETTHLLLVCRGHNHLNVIDCVV